MMNRDDVIKFIDGKVFYYSDYINFLYKQLELKDNIIKEVREYIEYQLEHLDFEKDTKAKILGAMVLVMLDKENK